MLQLGKLFSLPQAIEKCKQRRRTTHHATSSMVTMARYKITSHNIQVKNVYKDKIIPAASDPISGITNRPCSHPTNIQIYLKIWR